MRKIFGIGLNKTGTNSLSRGLEMLSFKSLHYRSPKHHKLIAQVMLDNIKHERRPCHGMEYADAFLDFFVPATSNIYPKLDEAYPGSRFILTVRDPNGWLLSREKHVTSNRKNPHYKGRWLTANKDAWTKRWNEHNADVKEYFKDRPEDLLVINICNGDGWEKLCPFLDVEMPDSPFPRLNIRKDD